MAGGVVLTRDQVRALDRLAIDAYGVPGLVLMENAGRAVADVARDAGPVVRSVAVLCGGGNNGGDGYVAARHLHNAGCAVAVYAATAPAQLAGDAAVNANIVDRMGLAPRVLATEDDVCDAAAE